ncbi:hypothetical protein B0H17DRAFT_1126927 [Mycena rosella]|uniref:Uncharacterized protein n=1 Tax=Mycena rosella TaxID=1033263 RepID=A0AAD7GRT7_MYCRO|nr:hypothetical protein B0H17DRAFT_1126927 [Mycena rosella]
MHVVLAESPLFPIGSVIFWAVKVTEKERSDNVDAQSMLNYVRICVSSRLSVVVGSGRQFQMLCCRQDPSHPTQDPSLSLWRLDLVPDNILKFGSPRLDPKWTKIGTQLPNARPRGRTKSHATAVLQRKQFTRIPSINFLCLLPAAPKVVPTGLELGAEDLERNGFNAARTLFRKRGKGSKDTAGDFDDDLDEDITGLGDGRPQGKHVYALRYTPGAISGPAGGKNRYFSEARSRPDKIWDIRRKTCPDKNRSIGRVRDLASKEINQGPTPRRDLSRRSGVIRGTRVKMMAYTANGQTRRRQLETTRLIHVARGWHQHGKSCQPALFRIDPCWTQFELATS